MSSSPRVLLTGATGFVGRHLPPVLRDHGFEVIGATRNVELARTLDPKLEWRTLDVGNEATIERALAGCQAAIYLIHGMTKGGDYEEKEARSALAFRRAAERAGVTRIVYLGGMRPRGEPSRHLRSRLRTGEVLRDGRVSTIELRAAMVIGGGSQSWRIVRDLAARLPVMILPRWLDSKSQPIAIRDVAFAVAQAVSLEQRESRAFSLPGPDTLSAREILQRTARLLGSELRTVRVPVISPRLSSHWIRLVTRADGHIAAELVEGLKSDLLSDGDGFWALFPHHQRISFDEAARLALAEEEQTLPDRARWFERLLRAPAALREHPSASAAKERPSR